MRFFPNRRKLRNLQRSSRVFVPVSGRQVVVPFRPLSTLLIFFLTLLSGFLFLHSDIFQVKRLEFEFEEVADEALVRQRIMEEVLARSIFFLDSSSVESKIKESFPTIRVVCLEKSLPDRLSIKVAVRVPLAIVEDKNGSRFLVDEDGFLFREAEKEKLPVIKLGENFEGGVGLTVDEQGVAGYLETLDLAAEKGLETKAIYLRLSTIELRLKGTVVWLTTEDKISPQLELLTQLLQRYKLNGHIPKSVDLRFTRPVVRL